MQVQVDISHDLKATELAMTIKVSIQWLYLAANGCKTYHHHHHHHQWSFDRPGHSNTILHEVLQIM